MRASRPAGLSVCTQCPASGRTATLCPSRVISASSPPPLRLGEGSGFEEGCSKFQEHSATLCPSRVISASSPPPLRAGLEGSSLSGSAISCCRGFQEAPP